MLAWRPRWGFRVLLRFGGWAFGLLLEPKAPLTLARIRYYSVKVQGLIYLRKQYHRKRP